VNTTRIMAVAALIVASALAPHVARAQARGITRTDLQRHDLSVPGREVIQVLVEFAPGVVAPNHSHPIDRRERMVPTPARGAAATCVTKRSMYDDNNEGGADT
jgi:hypothetical protein